MQVRSGNPIMIGCLAHMAVLSLLHTTKRPPGMAGMYGQAMQDRKLYALKCATCCQYTKIISRNNETRNGGRRSNGPFDQSVWIFCPLLLALAEREG